MDTNVLAKNQEILLTIKRIGINGEGIGYYKRLAVFVKGALPKKEIIAKVTEVNNTGLLYTVLNRAVINAQI